MTAAEIVTAVFGGSGALAAIGGGIRFVWNKRSDLAIVLEGDWEMVTAYWQSPSDWHYDTLDRTQYVQKEAEE